MTVENYKGNIENASSDKEKINLLIKEVVKRAQEIQPEIKALYEDFHENPELGGQEIETSKKIADYLESLDIEIADSHVGIEKKDDNDKVISTGTGVIAIVHGLDRSRSVALRADIDALPVDEDPKNSVKSKKEHLMHACGHDIHTAALLGAAKILKELADKGELPTDVVLLFQPSEEKTFQKESGAVQMIKKLEELGIRKNIEAFFGQHVTPSFEMGKVNIKEGIQVASSGEIDITLKTKGGHVADVYEIPNVNRIFSEINTKLYDIFEPLFKKNQSIVANTRVDYPRGGYNIVPSEGKSTWVVRISSENYKKISKDVLQQIKEVVTSTVEKYSNKDEVSVKIDTRLGYRPIVHRDPALVNIVRDSAKQVIKDATLTDNFLAAGEDFSFYPEDFRGKQIPGAFAMVGSANPENGFPIMNHHTNNFKVDPDVLKDMASLHVAFVLNHSIKDKSA